MRLRAAALVLAVPLISRADTPNPSGRTMADVLAKLETFASAAKAEEKIPGMAYAVVKDGQVVFVKAHGKRKVTDAADTVTADTLFEIGSTTKAFTAALVAMEVEAGKLRWDDRVVAILPDFALYDPWVTAEFRVCDLMSQRSGMPAYSLDAMPFFGYGRADIQRALSHVEPTFSFRNGFGYENNLWLVAARLVEKLEGTSWEEAVTARIFLPLGMRDSTADPELARLVPDRATGHYANASGTVTPIPDDWAFAEALDVIGPAGSIRSTIGDFARWATFQLGHGTFGAATLLSTATVDAMHAPRTYIPTSGGSGSPRATAYALGWMHQEHVAGTLIWHNGGTPGMHSIVVLYELPNVALVVLTNSAKNLVPERMRDELFDLLLVPPGGSGEVHELDVFLDGPVRPKPRPVPLAAIPPLPFDRYVGTYENAAYGRISVQVRSGALVMSGGPRPLEGALVPWSGNQFVWKAPLGLPPEDTWVTFTVPPGRNATRLVATACKDVRGGVFTRTYEEKRR